MTKNKTAADVLLEPTLRYKVRYEENGETNRQERLACRIVPCVIGGPGSHLYVHGRERLAYTAGRALQGRLLKRLLAIPGVDAHQVGEEEFTVVFAPHLLPDVTKIVKPRVKRPAPAVGIQSRLVFGTAQTP